MADSIAQTSSDRYLFDISEFDLDTAVADVEAIEKVNPHRGDMRHLDRIVWCNDERTRAVGLKFVRDDEFWVPGHIPGRPIFPGVLQIESAAQLSSFVHRTRYPSDSFLGFTRVTDCSFRGKVVPGDTLVVLTREVKANKRRFVSDVQAIVGDKVVFEARLTGMKF